MSLADRAPLTDPPDATPFWGDPPDLPTCERWLVAVQSVIEDVQRDLSAAKDGATAFDHGQPVPLAHFHAWRTAKIYKKDKLCRRYRWLKAWRRDALSATRHGRLGLLERLCDAVRRWVDDDGSGLDAAYAGVEDALDALDALDGAEPRERAA